MSVIDQHGPSKKSEPAIIHDQVYHYCQMWRRKNLTNCVPGRSESCVIVIIRESTESI